MRKSGEYVRVHILFAVCGKRYECLFPLEESFAFCVQRLYEMTGEDMKDRYIPEDIRVFEKTTMHECDIDVALRALSVHDDMAFLVF